MDFKNIKEKLMTIFSDKLIEAGRAVESVLQGDELLRALGVTETEITAINIKQEEKSTGIIDTLGSEITDVIQASKVPLGLALAVGIVIMIIFVVK